MPEFTRNVQKVYRLRYKPKILVVGTGAVGGFYGGKLAQSGAHVSTLCRSDYEVVEANGVTVKSCWGDFTYTPAEVVQHAGDYSEQPDYILIALKALPEIEVADIIRDAVSPHTAIILLQNGINIEESLHKAYPDNELISGLAFICAVRTEPGIIHHMDYGRLVLGRYPQGDSDRVKDLVELFDTSGVPCETSNQVMLDRWKKLLWNAPFNTISVLGGGIDTCAILENKESAILAREIMKEVCCVASASGYELPQETIDRHLEDTKKMKPYKTSMLVDYELGRPMEVEVILGNVTRIAKHKGIAVPNLDCTYALMKLLNKRST
jgi:2-dehydropantoate 2-reductase